MFRNCFMNLQPCARAGEDFATQILEGLGRLVYNGPQPTQQLNHSTGSRLSIEISLELHQLHKSLLSTLKGRFYAF